MSKAEFLSVALTEAFIKLIAQQTGLEIRERDQADFSEKIFVRMKALNIFFPEEYYQLLRYSYQEWQQLVLLLTNLESYFFRDKEQFKLLRDRILPELIQSKEHNKTLRICSAGCSNGEEPLSLAILLKELIPYPEQWNLMILGVDINQEALKKAKQGIYTPWSLRSIDPEIRERYFLHFNNQYYLDMQIKQMVKFKYVNLVKDYFNEHNEMINLDLIICRNVFIYFEKSAIAKVLDKFNQILQPSGYLIAGHTELFAQDLSHFETKLFPESLVYIKKAFDKQNERTFLSHL
ncbi:protein-glutamate O-methyltransferase CheR [Scytonema hofmannii FACHB-248]|uniref:protein-glutamate O-methyltransferase n=1 Tax=Scytonema hofmannii FACHB-248 TaxID=1842502 RepID=A0ABR8GZH5_9CYAN|nr:MULTISPECIES: protein-glutamate O-methyltransferase CheR [Nostocales]MBD2608420.1 protein-glutamate O-methyltransferase CheR [Scytonema hofmannii FACHB-248]